MSEFYETILYFPLTQTYCGVYGCSLVGSSPCTVLYCTVRCVHAGLYLTGGLTSKCLDYITGSKPGTENLFMGALLDKVQCTVLCVVLV